MNVEERQAAQKGVERAARWHDLMAEEETRKAKAWHKEWSVVPARRCEELAKWHHAAAASIRELTV